MKNGKRLVFEAQLRFLIPRLRKFVELIKVKTCKQEEPKQKRLSLSTKDTVTASFQMKKKEFHTGFTPQQRPHLISGDHPGRRYTLQYFLKEIRFLH